MLIQPAEHAGGEVDVRREAADRVTLLRVQHQLCFDLVLGKCVVELKEAADCLRRSLDIWRELEEPAWQARTLDSLGEVHAIAGDCDGAAAAWREALALFEQLDSPSAENLRSRLSALTSH